MPDWTISTSRRLLNYAIQRIGKTEVAARLKSTEQQLEAWMKEDTAIPNKTLLALADLIGELDRPKK